MISLIGNSNIYKNIAVLSAIDNEANFKSFDDLENSFHEFLKKTQPDVPRLNKLGTSIIENKNTEQSLTNLFYTESLLDDMNQSSAVGSSLESEFQRSQESIRSAMEFIKLEFPEIYFTLQIAVDSIFLRKSDVSGGGSTSNAIGVVWVNHRDHWSRNDIVELLVHELTHTLVFIDELRYLHYPDYDLILTEDNYSNSAILQTKRPIDKVVHSIIVATEVVALRKNYLGEPEKPCVHPPSVDIIEQTLSAYDSLTSMPNYKELTTERSRYLLDSCVSILRDIEKS